MDNLAGVVLAAGLGTRMKSRVPKVLHRLCGKELVRYPVELLQHAGAGRIVVVVSPGNQDAVKNVLGETVEYAVQEHPLGTADALAAGAGLLKGGSEHVLVVGGDSPLVTGASTEKLLATHKSGGNRITLLSAIDPLTPDLGRVTRDGKGKVKAIVEAADDTSRQGQVPEINGGVYCFESAWLWENLGQVPISASGERYLTALAAIASSQGAGVDAVPVDDASEIWGVNDRVQLSNAETVQRRRICERLMLDGVTIHDPASVFIDAAVEIGQDSVILPNTSILGRSRIGENCEIGPGSVIRDSAIGNDCRVTASMLEEATMETGVDIGPFSHLRPGAYLETGVHIGNYVEVKESRFAAGSVMGHFGYVGDASIGANVNVGAGMVTCNYDGKDKHRTVIEENAFIGCDTMLVAPVTVGAGAVTGAGAVVTKSVPASRLAVGVPAKIRDVRNKSE